MRSGIMGALFKPRHDMETGMQSSWQSTRSVIVAAALMLAAALAPIVGHSQTKEFEPVVGQEGKDVIWVPTPQSLVERMLEMAKTTPQDYVVDLGSGDGRTVITAAKKYGVQALGIEALAIGREIDPGVPWTAVVGESPLALALKSGNFGGVDFFEKALRATDAC